MTSRLFSPIEIGGMQFHNRIAVSPMCQYSADDGSATDWHLQHWMMLAMSGAGLVTVEATGVERRGRITHSCLGLYSDNNEAAAARALAAARRVARPGTRFGVQLAHAGRKASTQMPWQGSRPLGKGEDAWSTVAPSAIPYADGWHIPEALDRDGITAITAAFVEAAKRAERAGFDYVEIHGAHGYLLHEFLSPLANRRDDDYGGRLENRMRFIVEVAGAVRAVLPPAMIIGARLSATDWVEGGFDVGEAVVVARALHEAGVAFVCASSGGVSPNQKVTIVAGYQVPFAERIRREAGLPSRAVGLITEPKMAEAIVAEGRADLVALGRAILADPRWPWRAAAMLGAKFYPPAPYLRAAPTVEAWAAAPAETRRTAA
jgi:2,4-dienoyl-CoA reductase-like NADH-dependent reductase (Old Yellow Enzyme family)